MTMPAHNYDNYPRHPRRVVVSRTIRRLQEGERGEGYTSSRRLHVLTLDCGHVVERRNCKDVGETVRCNLCPQLPARQGR